jgi:hypothetical protein
MCFAGAGTADQDGVTLLGDEAAAGEIIDQRLVDGCAFELEVLKVLGQRQFGDGELVLDRAGLLLIDLGAEQIADNALGFVLALDGGRHDLVEGGLQAVGCDLYLHQQALDTSTPSGRAMFQMCGVFAEFERSMIRERGKAGLARARSKGIKLGRRKVKASVEEQIQQLRQGGMGILKIGKPLELAPASCNAS